jgi:hypothetical protein
MNRQKVINENLSGLNGKFEDYNNGRKIKENENLA